MKTILKSGYENILDIFYRDKSLDIHLRDIARRTKLNENSASRFLKQLEENGMLISKKDGNLKKYSIQKNKRAFAGFSLFDVERFDRLPNIRKNAVTCFFQKLEEKPVIAVLFGSTAKGSFTERSDVDLLLVVNRKIKTNQAENYAESQTGISINCIQITFDDFAKEVKTRQDKVIQSAINSGYPLTNHIYYYEVILQ